MTGHMRHVMLERSILSGVSSNWVYPRLSEELFIFENPAFPRDVVRKIDGQRHKNVKIVTGLFVAHKLEGVAPSLDNFVERVSGDVYRGG